MTEQKKRGGWRNAASADNGRKATGGGRPRVVAEFRKGEAIILERQSLGALNPFHPPERGIILSVSADEIEIQVDDDIIVLRRPDTTGTM